MAEQKEAKTDKPIRVRAKTLGIYGGRRWRKGMEFYLKAKSDMREWMEPWDDDKAEAERKEEADRARKAAAGEAQTMSDLARGMAAKP